MLERLFYGNENLRRTFIQGCLLRVVFLIIVVILGDTDIEPYIMSDDRMYEELAVKYLDSASGLYDIMAARALNLDGFLQVFWPYFICVSAKLMGTAYAGRILNVVFSSLCILLVYRLIQIISDKEETAMRGAKLMAFFPYMVIICVFPLKDIFLSTCVLYMFLKMLEWHEGISVPTREIIFAITLAVCAYLTRGGVVEFLGISLGIFVLHHFLVNRRYVEMAIFAILIIVVFSYLWNDIIGAFEMKLEAYKTESFVSDGTMRYIQIYSLSDFWRLPFAYFFAIVQPMTMNLFNLEWTDWSPFLRLLNLSAYPVAFGNLCYIVMTKKNLVFWLATFVMFASVISLSLGIYRHYMFLYPTLLINYALIQELENKFVNSIILYGSIAMIALVVILSL